MSPVERDELTRRLRRVCAVLDAAETAARRARAELADTIGLILADAVERDARQDTGHGREPG